MAYVISKKFEFDFAHRVPTQNIIKDLCFTCQNKCKRIHGHTGYIEVFLTADKLDTTGMVTDYTNLKWFKEDIVNRYFDHKFIISIPYDTLWEFFLINKFDYINIDLQIFRPDEYTFKVLSFGGDAKKLIEFLKTKVSEYELVTINARVRKNYKFKSTHEEKLARDYINLLESLTLINNYTTAESLAYILFQNLKLFFEKYFNPKFKRNVSVSKVCFYETQDSTACYSSIS
jgi:6-pyruvoyl-tetrahydropterin synthase